MENQDSYKALKFIDERHGSLYIGVNRVGFGLFRSTEDELYFIPNKTSLGHLPKEIVEIIQEDKASFDSNSPIKKEDIRNIDYFSKGRPSVFLNENF